MDEHLEARDAKLRQLAFDVSAALAGNNVVDAIGAATVFIVAQLDICNDPTITAWAASKLRQAACVLDEAPPEEPTL